MTSSKRIPGLEWWRGFLAIYIVLHHGYFWLGHQAWVGLPDILMSQGRTAVVWMFVLSGWVAGISHTPFGSWGRVRRLLLLVFVAVFWGFALEELATILALPGIISSHPVAEIDQLLHIARADLHTRLSSIFEPRWPLLSINHPVWTLRYDLLIALCLPWWLRGQRSLMIAVVVVAIALLPLVIVPLLVRESLVMIGSWLLGYQFVKMAQRWTIMASLVAVLLLNTAPLPIVWRDVLLATTSLSWVWALTYSRYSKTLQVWGWRLGKASLPLYLLHYPILVLARLIQDKTW